MSTATAGLLLLTDGRLPAGGYAHSGGLEAAVRTGRVQDMEDLRRFLTGRATTTDALNAAFAAAACARSQEAGDALPRTIELLDAELDARTPSPTLRRVSRTLGRQLLRALVAVQPHPLQQRIPHRIHHPVAFGAAAAMLDLQPIDAARGLLHETVAGPAAAVVKLISSDPLHAYRVLADLRVTLDGLAAEAAGFADVAAEELPAYAAPLSDLLGESHATQEVRLFAS